MAFIAALSLPLVIVAFLLFVRLFGRIHVLMISLVVTLMAFPQTIGLLSLEPAPQHSGIAPAAPFLSTFSLVAIALLFVMRWDRVTVRVGGWFGPALVWVAVQIVYQWGGTASQWAGLQHLIVAVAFAAIGASLAREVRFHPRGGVVLATWILVLVATQTIVVLLQFAGMDIFPKDANAELYEAGRPNGTFGHPGTLGKIYVLLLPFVLPLLSGKDRSARLRSMLSISLMGVGLVLTASRTNFAAFLVVLALWALFAPGSAALGRRLTTLVSLFIGVAATWGVWAWRTETGENGSFRAQLLQTAMGVIAQNPSGVGVNSYIAVVSLSDPNAAAGWPVHNAFVLMVAELGWIGAVLLLLPFVMLALRALRARRSDPSSLAARGYLVVLPGLVLIGYTGWGLLGDSLPLVFAAFGYSAGAICQTSQTLNRNRLAVRNELVTGSVRPRV